MDRSLLTTLTLSRAVVDRAAERRTDALWLEERIADPRSRLMRVSEGMARMQASGSALDLVAPADAQSRELTLLGVDDDDVAYFAEHVSERDDAPWQDLRAAGAQLSDRDAGLMVTAVALDNWLRSHRLCPLCGEATVSRTAGWSRRCPGDGSEHFPRTDPAVIVLVRDRDDRALLGRQGAWPEGRFSTLAGFVEAGESAEAAVRREVREESGVVVSDDPGDLVYLGSQPWPFPCSLMLGYHAWTDDPSIDVDGEEIAEAYWFTREELLDALGSGRVRLPPQISISRRLIERWYGAELP